MNYKPRAVFVDFHTTPWHRAILLCHRRAGKTVASCAELLKRAYNGPDKAQYLFISPLVDQSIKNTIGIFQTLDNGEGYIIKFDKTDGVIHLANGAQITLGGARSGEKFRGRALWGVVVDEISQVDPLIISDVLFPCLADHNGWLVFLGTARSDDDYRLYRMYKQYNQDPNWLAKKVSVYDNPQAFPPERIKEIHDEHIKFCLASGMSITQAEQSFNVEFECNFDFIDQGKPNMTAMFYPELQNLFDDNPPRLLDPTDKNIISIPPANKIAVFDIQHSTGRDYTVATIVAETTTTPVVTNIVWENNQPWQYWYDYLRNQGIRTVALPFDAATTNKETMLSLVQTFKREGFNVVRIKRLLREEQIENGRWLFNNARFSKDTIPALSQMGMFQDFTNKHGLAQDVVASFLYAGQVMRKKHTKLELASQIKTRYNDNMDVYNTGTSLYGTIITGE